MDTQSFNTLRMLPALSKTRDRPGVYEVRCGGFVFLIWQGGAGWSARYRDRAGNACISHDTMAATIEFLDNAETVKPTSTLKALCRSLQIAVIIASLDAEQISLLKWARRNIIWKLSTQHGGARSCQDAGMLDYDKGLWGLTHTGYMVSQALPEEG